MNLCFNTHPDPSAFPKDSGFEGKVPVVPLTLWVPPVFIQRIVSPRLTVTFAGLKDDSLAATSIVAWAFVD